jgi:hypothetical protein
LQQKTPSKPAGLGACVKARLIYRARKPPAPEGARAFDFKAAARRIMRLRLGGALPGVKPDAGLRPTCVPQTMP